MLKWGTLARHRLWKDYSFGGRTNRARGPWRGRPARFLINGVPTNDDLRRSSCGSLFGISPFAIEHVEVLRGSTALFGAGAPGGVINLITRRAKSDKLEVDAAAQWSFNPHERTGSDEYNLHAGAGQRLAGWDCYVGGSFQRYGVRRNPDGGIVPGTEFRANSLNASAGAQIGPGSLRKHHAGVRRPALTAAYAVSALILTAAVAGGVAEIRGYRPVVGAGRAWPSVPWPVSAFIAAWGRRRSPSSPSGCASCVEAIEPLAQPRLLRRCGSFVPGVLDCRRERPLSAGPDLMHAAARISSRVLPRLRACWCRAARCLPGRRCRSSGLHRRRRPPCGSACPPSPCSSRPCSSVA